MIIAYVFLLFLILIGLNFHISSFNEQYITRDSTTSINGFFVVIVFFSHFKQYVDLGNEWYNSYFGIISSYIGQLMVVMFFFYSGFGIFKQIQKPNRGKYIRAFLGHRFVPVFFQFAVCILLFLIVDIIIGRIINYNWIQILLSFTGWTSIGNSNWFMFVTFILYLIVYASFRLFDFRDAKYNLLVLSIFSVGLIIVLFFTKESYWWNTLVCFPLGMWYGYFQKSIESFMKNPKQYWLIVVPLLIVVASLWIINIKLKPLGKAYIILSLLYALSVVAITMKLKMGNRFLTFFGRHVFSIYMIQRIPMIIFKDIVNNMYAYFIICFVITVVLAVVFDFGFNKVKDYIHRIW